MGILLACEGKKARLPYRFKVTGTGIYTAEELFYYIYHNFLLLTDELLDESFLQWLERELFLTEKAEKIRGVKKGLSVFDALLEAAVILLSGGGYYTEEEVGDFKSRQGERKNMTPAETLLKKADGLLSHEQYSEAGLLYETLLNGEGMQITPKEEEGNIRHNLGVCRLYLEGFERAAGDFKAAYEITGREESKRQYLLCILLSGKEKEDTCMDGMEPEDREKIKEEVALSLLRYQDTESHKRLEKMRTAKEDGRLVDFVQEAGELIAGYKRKYRAENA